MDSNRFYVYCHIKKTDGKCFYIGKGCGNRYKSSYKRNQYWNKIVNKHGFEPIILVNNISEEKAFELEADFCKQIGYKNLCNVHVEDGWGGHSITEETRKKMQKPRPNSGNRGPKSEEIKQKLKQPRPGSGFVGPRSEETKQKIKKSWKNKDKQDIIKRIKEVNNKKVKCNELNIIFESVQEASKKLNINPRSITNNIHGRSKYVNKSLTFTYLL